MVGDRARAAAGGRAGGRGGAGRLLGSCQRPGAGAGAGAATRAGAIPLCYSPAPPRALRFFLL
jgi:hypothetical protein